MSRNKSRRNIPPVLFRKNTPKLKFPPKVEVKNPKVSVVLTSYNHAAYIGAAIESVLNQTFTDFELLIVDDGSTDNSREIISSYDDPRIKTFLYEENRGPRIAVMDATAAAHGKYAAIHHSDDIWREDKLQKQVDFLDAHEEYVACFTWVDFIDENGVIQDLDEGDFYNRRFDQSNRSRAEWLNYFFYQGNCLCHPSLMIRREAYRKYDLLKTNGLWQLPDYAMWIKLAFNTSFFILDEKLTLFRLRRKKQENISAFTFETVKRSRTERFWVLHDFINYFKDNQFFLEVFPETKEYFINGEFNRRFAFAKLCLNKDEEDFQLIGLEILKNLLSNNDTAAQIKRLYDYDEKSFFRDNGNYDVFNLAQKLLMLKGTLYFDTGNNFNADEVIEKLIFVDGNGKFYAKYFLDSDKPIKNLRFDPGDDIISIRIESAKINGVEQKNFTAQFAKYDDKFYNFLTFDPQFIFPAENLTGKITFEILGEINRSYPVKFNRYFHERENQFSALNTEFAKLNQKIKNLERANTDVNSLNVELNARNENLDAQIQNLNAQNENLNSKIQNLNAQNENLNSQIQNLNAQNKAAKKHIDDITTENHRLNKTLNEILNSNSWKMTKPLRKIGGLFKKI